MTPLIQQMQDQTNSQFAPILAKLNTIEKKLGLRSEPLSRVAAVSAEEKEECIRMIEGGELGICEVAEMLGLKEKEVTSWLMDRIY